MKKQKDAPKEKTKYKRVTFMWEGKRYERKGKTLGEAHAKAAALKESLKRGEVGISGNMTVARWAYEWLDVYKKPVVGDKQYDMYYNHIKSDIAPAIGGKAIKDIKPVELQKIINARSGQSRSSIDKITITLKSIFERAYRSGLTMRNPAEYLEKPAAVEGTHRSITPEERKVILEVAETHRAGLWVKLLLYCGLRPGESRALQWRHVDFDKRIIHIEQSMKADSRVIGTPKSAAGVRDVPIPDVLYSSLQAARREPFMPVIERETKGLHHTKSSMRVLWVSFKRELDISMGAKMHRNQIIIHAVADDLVPYCLRHTYCTDLEEKGVPINVARYLMGHSDIKMTSRIYTHTTEKTIQAAAKLINKTG